jgi:chromosome segregation ATPase
LQNEITELKADYERTKQEITNVETTSDKLKALNKVLDQELKDNKGYIDKLRISNERFSIENSQLNKLREEEAKENARLLDLNSELQLLKAQIGEIYPENEKLHQHIEDINVTVRDALSGKKELEHELATAKQQYEAELKTMVEESKILKDEASRLRTNNTNLKVKVMIT